MIFNGLLGRNATIEGIPRYQLKLIMVRSDVVVEKQAEASLRPSLTTYNSRKEIRIHRLLCMAPFPAHGISQPR